MPDKYKVAVIAGTKSKAQFFGVKSDCFALVNRGQDWC